jgi:hypothetical protein
MGADISYNSQKITTYTFYISVSTQKKNIIPEYFNEDNHRSREECKTERSYLNTANAESLYFFQKKLFK